MTPGWAEHCALSAPQEGLRGTSGDSSVPRSVRSHSLKIGPPRKLILLPWFVLGQPDDLEADARLHAELWVQQVVTKHIFGLGCADGSKGDTIVHRMRVKHLLQGSHISANRYKGRPRR